MILNINFLQNLEYWTLSPRKVQYLLVHSTGCSSIRNTMGIGHGTEYEAEDLAPPNPDFVKWTCYKDPVERFKSGLFYDIKTTILNNSYEDNEEKIFARILNDERTFDCYNSLTNSGFLKKRGTIPHTVPQSVYWVNQPLDVFVPIEVLDMFLEMHFGFSDQANVTEKNSIYYLYMDMISKYDTRIRDLHKFDYFFLQRLINEEMVWRWQNGKIF